MPKVSNFDVMKKLADRNDKSLKMFPLPRNMVEIDAGNPKKKKWAFVKVAIDDKTATALLKAAMGQETGVYAGLYVIDKETFDAVEKELSNAEAAD